MTQHQLIRAGFIAGGLINIGGTLLFTMGFTSPHIAKFFPGVFSDFGMFAIVLWGLAYLAVAESYAKVPWLVAVFALEKAAYVVTWIVWMKGAGFALGAVFAESFLAGAFYAVYGINDLAFAVFFGWVFWRCRARSPAVPGDGR